MIEWNSGRQMELRYGTIDENVKKRSVQDVILHEGQRFPGKKDRPAPLFSGIASMPVMFGEKRAGELAVIAAVNDLAARGIQATEFSPVILLPPGTQEDLLRMLIKQICRTAFPLGIDVREGRTEVTHLVNRPVVTGTAAGIPFFNCFTEDTEKNGQRQDPAGGDKNAGSLENKDACVRTTVKSRGGSRGGMRSCAGMDIVMAGFAGLEGTYLLATEHEEELRDRFSGSLLYRIRSAGAELCIAEAAKRAFASGAGPMAALAGGGVLAGLWELCKKTGCGMETELPLIPVLQETIEITEFFGLDPYSLQSGGGLLIAAGDGENTVRMLSEHGLFSVRIGRLTEKKDRILRNGEEIRYLDRPRADSLTQLEIL